MSVIERARRMGPRPAAPGGRLAQWWALGTAPSQRRGVLAILALGLAFAIPIQAEGWNQTSHYALVRALDHGTPQIDAYKATTGDEVLYRDHWYANKAPGFAFWELPAYKALKIVGLAGEAKVGSGDTNRAIWLLGLWGTVLPGIVLLLLVRSVAERLEPGFGTAAALTVGLGSLIFPFATMLFSHLFSATLVFGAFAVLFHEFARPSPARRWVVGSAGLLVGLATTTEYPSLLAGLVLGLYALARMWERRRPAELLDRAACYALGAAIGVVPVLLYNRWAFGSFTHIAYANMREQQTGFFGVGVPHLSVALKLLLSYRGLLTLAPVLVMAGVGAGLLYRRGSRPEALTIAGIGLLLLLNDSGFVAPFGGLVLGPRYLITWLPFLGIALAPAWRRYPGPTLTLGIASAVAMLVPTMTQPMVGLDSDPSIWAHLLGLGQLQATALTGLGVGSSWIAWGPVIGAMIAAVVLAALCTPARLTRAQVEAGVVAVCAWAVFAATGPEAVGIAARGLRPIVTLAVICLATSLAAVAFTALAQPRLGKARLE
jgi:hypothetical protein